MSHMANPVKPVEVKCRVTHFKELTSTVFQIDFVCEPRIPFQAGQFISIVIPGAGPSGKDLRRAYSIASGPENEGMQLCVKLVEGGPGTQYLYKLREGDASF
jgi:ferredoxin-NADP reductase